VICRHRSDQPPPHHHYCGYGILLCVPFPIYFRGFLFEQPVTFHHMQSFGVRGSIPVDHRKRPDLDANRVYDQRVAFIMAD
jgi:hypothetical protein